MDLKYRLKVVRSRWQSQKLNLPEGSNNKSTLVITVKDPTKEKSTKNKCIFLCSGFEINKEECQGEWDKRFLIEPTIDGVTIEAQEGFYFVK